MIKIRDQIWGKEFLNQKTKDEIMLNERKQINGQNNLSFDTAAASAFVYLKK